MPDAQSSPKLRRSRAQWQHILSDFNASGLSAKAFCQQQQLPYSSFAKWRSLLKPKDQSPVDSAAAFIELPSLPTSAPWDLELDLGSGIVLRLRRS